MNVFFMIVIDEGLERPPSFPHLLLRHSFHFEAIDLILMLIISFRLNLIDGI
jgi:hypothetical protein